MKQAHRQGDVWLTPVSELPKDAKPIKGTTIAYGESTGHHHTIYANEGVRVQLMKSLDDIYVKVTGGKAYLIHTDEKTKQVDQLINSAFTRIKNGEDFHKPQILEEGMHKVNREMEENPFTEELERTMD